MAAVVSGCALFPSQQAISTSRIREVVDDAKRQVSIYQSYQNSLYDKNGRPKFSQTNWCGNALIDFDITEVKLDLLTTLDTTVGGGVSATDVPIAPVATAGFNFTGSLETTNTQELVFAAKPLPDYRFHYRPSQGEAPAPLAEVMISLREALIKASQVSHRVCFQTVAGSGDGNTFKIAITIVSDASGKLTLGLAPLSLSASGEAKGTTGNTITFTFAPTSRLPHGGKFLTEAN
jgi:hypothetical protein